MNRKAITLVPNELIELILVVAGAVLLIFLFASLMGPSFDFNKEAAKSYLKTFESEMQKADNKQTGEFSVWQPVKDTTFYLIYFGNSRKIDLNKMVVRRKLLSLGSNSACICYIVKTKATCESCISLKYPAELKGSALTTFAFGLNEAAKISKGDGKYIFTKADSTGAAVKKTVNLFGKQREMIIYPASNGDAQSCVVRGLSAEDLGGYVDLAGDYWFEPQGKQTRDANGKLMYAGRLSKDSVLGPTNMEYFLPGDKYDEYSLGIPLQNTEVLREIRKALDEKIKNLKFEMVYHPSDSSNEIKTVNANMILSEKGLEVEIPNEGKFIYEYHFNDMEDISEYNYPIGSYRWRLLMVGSNPTLSSRKIQEISSAFGASVSSSANQISVGAASYQEEKFNIGLTVAGPLSEPVVYIADTSGEKNYLDSQNYIFGINGAGEMYSISKLYVSKDGSIGTQYNTQWQIIPKGVGRGMYIYLNDEDAEKKSNVLSQLKRELKMLCFTD